MAAQNPPSHPASGSPSDHPEARLAALGLSLPKPSVPVAAYIPTRRTGGCMGGGGSHLYIAGQVPFVDGKLLATGAVPSAVSLELAQQCARQCTLNALAHAKVAVGDLSRVRLVLRVGVFVACDPTFIDHPKVANGASDLLVAIFGEAGKHARAAVGAPSLPLGAPVEVEMLLEVE